MQQETKTYKFSYKHINHSLFTGTIVATSEENRDKQMRNLLFARFRRKLELDSIYGKVMFVEVTDKE